MIHFTDALLPNCVRLDVGADSLEAAVEASLDLLRGDARVPDWDAMAQSVRSRGAPAIEENGCGICIAHGRSETVSQLVMSAVRLEPGAATPGIESPLRLVFVACIPVSFSNEYLRLVGAIARICHDSQQLNRLLGVQRPERFIELLESQLNLV